MDLKEFFQINNKVALGFSGGVDSSYLLYAAKEYGADVKAYYINSQFQPAFELEDALRVVGELDASIKVINCDILENFEVVSNPNNRCYHCKKAIFEALQKQAFADGYRTIIDGTNASDQVSDRPGMLALTEMEVKSPLRECGITKDKVRELSKDAGLFTWNKPAYACLATRIPTGMEITFDLLEKIEKSEKTLVDMGLSDIRVRIVENGCKLQVPDTQIESVIKNRGIILEKLKHEFDFVLLDLEGR
ncbi:MAG: ATP-dependent sacrificial sulfur transferase LarE [Anaerovoracaceae bacterium]